jgi:hypothetical protein
MQIRGENMRGIRLNIMESLGKSRDVQTHQDTIFEIKWSAWHSPQKDGGGALIIHLSIAT